MKKTVSILLLTSLLLSAASCGEDTSNFPETSDTSPTSVSENETNESSGVPKDLDLGGETINIWYTTSPYSTVETFPDIAGELTGETLSDLTYNTNRKVEEKLGCTLNFYDSLCQSPDTAKEAKKLIMADSSEFDMFHLVQYNAVNLIMEGYLMNVYDAPYISYDKPWWNRDYMSEMAAGKDRYFLLVGDYCIDTTRNLTCIFYNKSLYEDFYGDPDGLYQEVLDGKWTWDRLRSICEDVYVDLDSDGKTGRGDQYGFSTNSSCLVDGLFYGTGARITARDENNYPTLILNNERSADIAKRLYELVYETKGVFNGGWQPADFTQNRDEFAANQSMFLLGFFYTAESLREMKGDFGIIPCPKYDETQDKYYSVTQDITRVMGVPKGCQKFDAVCAVLEELSFEGNQSVLPTYYDVLLKYKYSRDDYSGQMIDTIRENCRPDLAYIYAHSLNLIGYYYRFMIDAKSSDFASYYAKNEPKALTGIETLIEQFSQMEN